MSVSAVAAGASAATLVALCWKALPFAYHLRLLSAVAIPRLKSKVFDPDEDGQVLVNPIIQQHFCPLSDLDLNIHKSNSTYFLDLDIVRVGLIMRLFAGGLRVLSSTPSSETGDKERATMLLAGVQCSFRQEITPFSKYETWSKVLYWDEKWIFFVTYFVRPKSSADARSETSIGNSTSSPDPHDVLATSISKGIVKAGRRTITPARLFEACGFMRPSDQDESTVIGWTRQRIEQERAKGAEYAHALLTLDRLSKTFARL